MNTAFWRRPIPNWARWTLSALGALILLVTGISIALWFQFHRAYAHWLESPPAPLTGHSRRLILEGEVTGVSSEGDVERFIDAYLLQWRDDPEVIVELSRSDALVFRLLGRAYVRVFLRTHLPGEDVDQRVEFVSEFTRRGGRWEHRETVNLAIP